MHAPEFVVNVTVGPGKYYARLKLSENQFQEANRRAVSIYVNGRKQVERLDIVASVEQSLSYQRLLRDKSVAERYREPARHALDLVFQDIEPHNGIIELHFVGEPIGGVPTEAILNALEVGPGDGGEGAMPVMATQGR